MMKQFGEEPTEEEEDEVGAEELNLMLTVFITRSRPTTTDLVNLPLRIGATTKNWFSRFTTCSLHCKFCSSIPLTQVIDIPLAFRSAAAFTTTLGHKVNHRFTGTNTEFSHGHHPVFGGVVVLLASTTILPGQVRLNTGGWCGGDTDGGGNYGNDGNDGKDRTDHDVSVSSTKNKLSL